MRRATAQPLVGKHVTRISIHALHEESDLMACGRLAYTKTFQSTLSMRRATRLGRTTLRIPAFQSTLSMRRATGWLAVDLAAHSISIHALHEESDAPR